MKVFFNFGKRISSYRIPEGFIQKRTFKKKRIYFAYQEIWLNTKGFEYVKYTSNRSRLWNNKEINVGEFNGFGHKLLELNKCYLIN